MLKIILRKIVDKLGTKHPWVKGKVHTLSHGWGGGGNKMANVYNDKILNFSRTTGLISTKLGTKNIRAKEIQVCSNEGSRLFPRGNNNKILKTHW